MGFKNHFSLLKIPSGQISLVTNFDNKSVDQSDPTKVCDPTLYSRKDQVKHPFFAQLPRVTITLLDS
jgi:hypothetical protein